MNIQNLNCLIDLHLHLDGSLPLHTVKELAEQQGITLQMTDWELKKKLSVPAGCRDLNEYLTKFEFPLTLMQTPEALEKCMHDLLTELEGQGVQYCEVRFAPQLHTQKGMSQNEVIEAVKAGLYSVAGVKPESIHAGIILCCMRGSDNGQQNKITVEEAARHLGSGVCAVDLAGAEALYPTEQYADLFAYAKQLRIPVTIHAGEAAGTESIRAAVAMGAARIGHGIRAAYDAETMELLKEHHITLELCPTSNLNTKVVDSIGQYPIRQLMDAGVAVTINTDNMTVSDTCIQHEYQLLADTFAFGDTQIKEFLYHAAEASFTTEDIKQLLKARITYTF